MFRMFSSQPATPGMTAAEAIQKSAAGEIVVLDIRDGGEVAMSGKAKGALHVPLAALRMKADPSSPECLAELKSGKPIAVYCASGARSSMAAQALGQMGHKDVHNIGGLAHWAQAGGEIIRSEQ
ncbi:rhodanese-like domain-containing protein [Marivivens marinus]|uniref:rhodanese-like domain-containing protein n=1 Tax=Marivivens marinus TaxID=3110173 RepID=UPI003B84A716